MEDRSIHVNLFGLGKERTDHYECSERMSFGEEFELRPEREENCRDEEIQGRTFKGEERKRSKVLLGVGPLEDKLQVSGKYL